jgi:hypothetical protein
MTTRAVSRSAKMGEIMTVTEGWISRTTQDARQRMMAVNRMILHVPMDAITTVMVASISRKT